MRVLALEPYYGGSHRAFIDGWIARSRHEFSLLTLPAHHWKWRMRHSAVTLAEQIRALWAEGAQKEPRSWDLMWCSSMLNLGELLSLLPRPYRTLPCVAYFHENQVFYPSQHPDPRDVHFAFTNWTTALSADQVWFNSQHNLDSLCEQLLKLFKAMPDYKPHSVDEIRQKSRIEPPPICGLEPAARTDGPLHVVWAARWEHDKNPEDFFAALRSLKREGTDFRVSVLGPQFRSVPAVFQNARQEFAEQLLHFGELPRDEYEGVLRSADVVVSTANHEFFGLAVMEAVSAGCVPLLPARLVYPELFSDPDAFYDGSVAHLATRLKELSERKLQGRLVNAHWQKVAAQYDWQNRAPKLDTALETALGAALDRASDTASDTALNQLSASGTSD